MKNQDRASERRTARLIAFGVLFYAAVMNLDDVAKGFQWLMSLFSPVLLGLILALILDVPMHGFQRIFRKLDRRGRMSPKLSSALSLLLSVVAVPVVLILLMNFVIPQFISAITNVIGIVRSNEDKIVAMLGKTGLNPENVALWLDELADWVSNNLARIAGTAVNTAMLMVSSVMDVVIAAILAIYLLADKAALASRCRRATRAFLPEAASQYIARVTTMFTSTFRTFLSRQCLEAVILGALMLVCMLIFRIPYSVTISCMTAVLALIPYVGAYLSLFIGCVLVVTVSPMKALIFAIVFLVAQQVEGNVIYPKVVGASVGLPAYITLSAVMIGGALAGIAGMVFIIPVVSVAYVLLREAVQRRNAEKDARSAESGGIAK